jgi:anti-sigma factor (TIGR02949 family)
MTRSTDQTTHEPPMLDCRAAVRMLWDYLDGHLDAVDEEAVRRHVTRCSHCFPHANFGQLVLDAVAQVRRDEPAPTSVQSGVLARLRAEGYEGP